jgi:hypothetical protein
MKEKETNSFNPFTYLRHDEEILWSSHSGPISLMKPFMTYLKICAIWGLILFAIAFLFQMMYSVGGAGYGREDEARYLLIDAFPLLLLASMPVILIVYGVYWRLTQYEPPEVYAVTNKRILRFRNRILGSYKRKTNPWELEEIKRIDIVEDYELATVMFTRINNEMSTWRDITDVEGMLGVIRDHRETPVLVNRLPK